MPDDPPVVEVRSLRKEYPTPAEPLVILDRLDLSIAAGSSAAIMGPSGSGKSTLLHILGALDNPTSGSVRLEGRDPFALSANQQAEFRNQRVGFVFQDHCLLPQLTALENVLTPTLAQPSRSGSAELMRRGKNLLERVGLKARASHYPAQLSGGERQRVAVARSLINSPALLLCDEPTGNLDRDSAASMGALLAGLQRDSGLTLVVVTHSPDFATLFSRTYELRGGRLEAVAR